MPLLQGQHPMGPELAGSPAHSRNSKITHWKNLNLNFTGNSNLMQLQYEICREGNLILEGKLGLPQKGMPCFEKLQSNSIVSSF